MTSHGRSIAWLALITLSLAAGRAHGASAATPAHAATVVVPAGVTGLTASAVPTPDPARTARADDWFRGLAPGWMPNRGQVAGANGRPDASVLYSLRTPGAQLHVTGRGLAAFFHGPGEDGGDARDRDAAAKWSAIEIELVGASIEPARARADARIEQLGEQHFYAPHCPDGVLRVPSYERVTFRDVYPNIDWVVVAGRGGPMHQDFVVRPGGDPARIRLRYRGVSDLGLDASGRTLHMRTALGEVREGPLRCWQGADSTDVPARFRLDGGMLSVRLGAWDRSRPLTIDPPLLWSTLYGGDSYDGPKSIFCDNRNGDVYVVGYTASSNLPCTTAVALAYNQGAAVPAAPPDAFIWKFSQQGIRQWATYYSGDSADYAVDCAVDRLGNLYVTGSTNSSDFPTQQLAGAYWQPGSGGITDAFLLRFDSQGIRQWATYYGGDGNDFGTGVVTDSTDQVYVCGYAASNDLTLANAGGYWQPALNGTSDSFILKFNTLGALVWGTYHGGNSGEQALGLAVNGTDLYMTGLTYSTVFPTVDPPGNGDYFQGATNGGQEGFISRFTLAGTQTWSTFYGGSGFDELREPAITASGMVYVSGLSNSSDMPVFNPNPIATPNQPAYFQGVNNGSFDLFVARFTPANARAWATYLGGSSVEDLGRGARSLALDSQGRAYLTGVSASTDFPTVNPGFGAYYQGTTPNSDVIYARFTVADSLEWSTFFGGAGASFGTGVALGVNDCLFGTGEFQGSGFSTTPVNPGAGAWFKTVPSGDDDGFVTKFCLKPHACCIELTCVGASSAAECAALGGTAFHPNQTCPQVNCNILCNVCGRKFSDLNRNGVQDPGEPGLPGWIIEMRDLANNVVAATITGANGDYCMSNVPCGNFTVTEGTQTGWVKVAPTGAGHSLSLPIASTTNNVDFANYACPTPPPCTPMPTGLSAWWPFDDGPGATQGADVTHAAIGRNAALLAGSASGGAGSLCLADPGAYAKVPASQQSALDFGDGAFGLSVWIAPDASTANGRVVVEKLGLTLDGGLGGWSLRLDGMTCMLSLTAGSSSQVVPGPSLPAGAWSHVAVSVDRAGGHGRWFLNGSPLSAGDFTPITGSLDVTADLWMGQTDPAFGVAGPGLQGCIAQLAIFHTPIGDDLAAKAYGPGPGTGVPVAWCPDYAVLPSVRAVCATQNSVQVCFSIGNAGAAPATYSWSLAGLAAAPPGCTNAGPTQFTPSAGTVTVPAGGLSSSICVTIPRPNGFTLQGATSCFALTFVNHTTGVCRTRTSKLVVDNSCWCATTNPTAVTVVPSAGRVIGVAIKRPCDPTALAYRVVANDPDTGTPDGSFVSLDGLAPGEPHTGTVNAGPGSDAERTVHVSFPGGFDAAAIRELVLEADSDGNGTLEPLASTFVAPAPEGDQAVDVPVRVEAAPVALLSSPNPFVTGTSLRFTLAGSAAVSLEIYDLHGRLVRSLVNGWLAPGARQIAWDGRDQGGRRVAPGVYLARLRAGATTEEARLVKVQ